MIVIKVGYQGSQFGMTVTSASWMPISGGAQIALYGAA
jgi:hypothetical protein